MDSDLTYLGKQTQGYCYLEVQIHTTIFTMLKFSAAMFFSFNYTVKVPISPKAIGVRVPAPQPFTNSNTLQTRAFCCSTQLKFNFSTI